MVNELTCLQVAFGKGNTKCHEICWRNVRANWRIRNYIINQCITSNKKIERETRQEIGIVSEAFFSNPTITERLIIIGQKYNDNDKILEEVIRTVTTISERFGVKTQIVYDFLISHIESKNNKIKFEIASCVPLLPQFDHYDKKWEYILSIPKIPPKKYSIDIFQRVIKRRIA